MNWVLLAVAIPTVGLLLAAIWVLYKEAKREPVQQRLQRWMDWEHQRTSFDDLQPARPRRRDTNVGAAANAFFLPALRRTLRQAQSPYNVVTFPLLVLLVTALTGALIWLWTANVVATLAAGILGGSIPVLILLRNKQQYRKKFEEQLPQALDMLARSLWAGHTIQAGIRTIGADFDEPIRSEFSQTAEAIDVGTPLPMALEQLAQRVDISDLHFFVTSVLVQRETGGNLADILSRTANLIRQRLEFNDRIKALSAQGRLSANVLCFLPIAIAGFIYFMNPDHYKILIETETGVGALIIVGIMMLIGIIMVRRLVKIEV